LFDLGGKIPRYLTKSSYIKQGRYLYAAAFQVFAFGEVNAVVDGKCFFACCPFFGIDTDIASGKEKKEFEILANQLIRKKGNGHISISNDDIWRRQDYGVSEKP